MGLIELFVIAVSLSMDAFAVSVCKGLSMQSINIKKALIVGLYFGIFQAGMPLIGYFLGTSFADKIVEYDHWLAFALLAVIGGKMVMESFEKNVCDYEEGYTSLTVKKMLPLALATSIDAVAVGISFAFLKVTIAPAVALIGIITLIISMIGTRLGSVFGMKYKSKAELVGGIVLILMGLKILLDHLNVF